MNYNAYGLESSRTPSYVSCTFGGIKASSGPVAALEEAAVKSTTVTKTETVVIKAEEKKEEEVKEEVKEEKKEEHAAIQEPAAGEEKEQGQEQVEAEAVAE